MNAIVRIAVRFLGDDKALETLEYAVLAALLIVLVIAAIRPVGPAVASAYQKVAGIFD